MHTVYVFVDVLVRLGTRLHTTTFTVIKMPDGYGKHTYPTIFQTVKIADLQAQDLHV